MRLLFFEKRIFRRDEILKKQNSVSREGNQSNQTRIGLYALDLSLSRLKERIEIMEGSELRRNSSHAFHKNEMVSKKKTKTF